MCIILLEKPFAYEIFPFVFVLHQNFPHFPTVTHSLFNLHWISHFALRLCCFMNSHLNSFEIQIYALWNCSLHYDSLSPTSYMSSLLLFLFPISPNLLFLSKLPN
uniref:Ovule protein n=1 Tax=Parascaris univalens TaxID=6257 RepID=A0A915AJJ7_PARUN